ncbi:hypothetical protein ACOBQX_23040 [Actinokineospora sp. G85]|uniref:hypothetical protein n=1 Tax=Actinokineospora sp. G85 TaxID=3406626 RepID=UPI003C76260F
MFVPDYQDGDRPLGNWNLDIGAVAVHTNATGTQGLRINGPTSAHVWSFGFPALPNPPFNGQRLITCDGNAYLGTFSNEMQHLCSSRQGASGGPWLAEFNGDWGYAISVYSNFIESDPLTYYGPYFGDGAYNLYQAVRYL